MTYVVRALSLICVIGLVLVGRATAEIIDFPASGSTSHSNRVAANDPSLANVWTGMAQSFTAQDPNVRFGFYVFNATGGPISDNLLFSLYSGDGLFSDLLTQASTPVNLATWATGLAEVDLSSISLTPGQHYTVVASMPSQELPPQGGIPGGYSDTSVLYNSLSNSYTGGRFYFVGSSYDQSLPAFANRDTGFRITPVSPPAPSITFDDVINGSVNVTFSGAEIDATFRPNFGYTLAEAALLGGYEHFNWYQQVLAYPGPTLYPTPFDDPPPVLGVGFQPSDNLPFYWDEGPCLFHCDPALSLAENTTTDELWFSDIPGNTYIGLPGFGDEMSFVTSLAGVRSDGSWDALHTFTWKSNYNPNCEYDVPYFDLLDPAACSGGGVFGARNVTPFLDGGTGGVLDAHLVVDLLDLPLDVRLQMRADGATNIPTDVPVPEPVTWLLLGPGLAMVAVRRRFTKPR